MSQAEKLSEITIEQWCKKHSQWQYREHKLYRKIQFHDFSEAFAFMTRVAMVAERMDHHPEWYNCHRSVELYLCSHDVSGVSERDLKLADFINSITTPAPSN